MFHPAGGDSTTHAEFTLDAFLLLSAAFYIFIYFFGCRCRFRTGAQRCKDILACPIGEQFQHETHLLQVWHSDAMMSKRCSVQMLDVLNSKVFMPPVPTDCKMQHT